MIEILKRSLLFTLLTTLFIFDYAFAQRPEFILKIKDHLFYPAEIEIPANQKVKLIIYNEDQTPEQFDSFDLNREKVIFAGKKSTIFIGPLPQGQYHFFGEFHPNSARGVVIVKNIPAPSKNMTNQSFHGGD